MVHAPRTPCPRGSLQRFPLKSNHVPLHVMAGLAPATHVLAAPQGREGVDAHPSRMLPTWADDNCRSREHPTSDDKRGHGGGEVDSIRTKPALVTDWSINMRQRRTFGHGSP